MFKHITAVVLPGIGDIFWVYRKLYNHCDEITFEVMQIENSANKDIQQRAFGFFKILPKIKEIRPKEVTYRYFRQQINQFHRLDDKFQDGPYIEYNVNAWLEAGIKLEDIDNNYNVAWDIPIPVKKSRKYAIVYVSGNTRHLLERSNLCLWKFTQWATFIKGVLRVNNIPEQDVLIIGADFDKPAIDALNNMLPNSTAMMGSKPEKVYSVLNKAKIFIGYQSGLNVIADHFNVPQVMVYFKRIIKMSDSWVKPDNRDKCFTYLAFEDMLSDKVDLFNNPLIYERCFKL